jgi:hypothetical protein
MLVSADVAGKIISNRNFLGYATMLSSKELLD